MIQSWKNIAPNTAGANKAKSARPQKSILHNKLQE